MKTTTDMKPISRRAFSLSVATGIAGASTAVAETANDVPVGPMVGHSSMNQVRLWYRPAEAGSYSLAVRDMSGALIAKKNSEAIPDNDRCVIWDFADLKPATQYRYDIESNGKTVAGGDDYFFKTAPTHDSRTKVCLAFGSCAKSEPLTLWTQMADRGAEGLILLGDTPYIDSTVLQEARKKHREFLSIPELSRFMRQRPVWGTWDDHDFGRNNSDGNLPGKKNTRQAFVEYRANQTYGEKDQGVYTKFRYGPVEVFLLDTRWFAGTEPSPVDAKKPTLLGRRQWDWLLNSLEKSTAPFKLITSGMIWDDKKKGKSDDWMSYSHERTALFDFLGNNKISGAVLIGGDIHCSRLLRYKTEQQVGYPIHQFIVSPIHDGTIPSLNVPHPDLIKGAAIPHVWLRLEVDSSKTPATIHAEWIQMNGHKMWDLKLNQQQLTKV
jgi:alkaline phosphatase D